jgi:hypothetical protein
LAGTYIASKRKEFKFLDLLYLLILLASFLLEYRILLNFTYAATGFKFPTLFIGVFFLIYFLRLRKRSRKDAFVVFSFMFLALYLLMFSLDSAVTFIPQFRNFVASAQPGLVAVTSNAARDLGILSRAFNIDQVSTYWNTYWAGILGYVGIVTVFLAFLALTRVSKLKETLLILSFPLLQASWWGLFVTLDVFQPRFVVCSSLFYFLLVASTIELIYSCAVVNSNTVKRLQLNFKIRMFKGTFSKSTRLITIFIIALLLVSLFGFTFPLYDKNKQVMDDWNYPYKYNSSSAFEWVSNNTSINDVLMSRSANFFAWFTNRHVAWSPVDLNLNLSGLMDSLRLNKVSYLVVDERWYYDFPNLRDLYDSPVSIPGFKIAFMSSGQPKVIIYNVTGVAFGHLIRDERVMDKGGLENWSPFTLYGAGSIGLDYLDRLDGNYSIKLTMISKEQPKPQVAFTFVPKESLNFSNSTGVIISAKLPYGRSVELKLCSDNTNYFVAKSSDLVFDKWSNLTFALSDFKVVLGNPNSGNITRVDFYLDGVEPNKSYEILIANIVAYTDDYVLKGVGS